MGPGIAPTTLRQRRTAAIAVASDPVTYPRRTSPCPVSCLVPLATEKSAPSSSGRCPRGEARVLSTATRAPRACAASASAVCRTRRARGWTGSRSTTAWRRRGGRVGRPLRSARCAPRCRTPPTARAPGAVPGSRRRAVRPRRPRAAARRAPTRWRPSRRRTRASPRRPARAPPARRWRAPGGSRWGSRPGRTCTVPSRRPGDGSARRTPARGASVRTSPARADPPAPRACRPRAVPDTSGCRGITHTACPSTSSRTAASSPVLAASTISRHSSKPSRPP